jgi:hypothetical protein
LTGLGKVVKPINVLSVPSGFLTPRNVGNQVDPMGLGKVELVPFAVNPIMPGDCAKCTTGGRNGRNKKYFQKSLDIFWISVLY